MNYMGLALFIVGVVINWDKLAALQAEYERLERLANTDSYR